MLALLTCDVYAIRVVLSARIGSAPLVAAAYPAYVNVPRGSFDKGILDPDILVDLFLPFVSWKTVSSILRGFEWSACLWVWRDRLILWFSWELSYSSSWI
jgi:hypothetical protein